MTYSIYPAARVDLPGQQEQFERVNELVWLAEHDYDKFVEALGFDPEGDEIEDEEL